MDKDCVFHINTLLIIIVLLYLELKKETRINSFQLTANPNFEDIYLVKFYVSGHSTEWWNHNISGANLKFIKLTKKGLPKPL